MKIAQIILLASFFVYSAQAQKLPNVQDKALRAPAGIKIDGKATEWGDKLQAYNKATEITYTIANDGNKLYLTVQATYHDIVDKILRGGLTFTINGDGKKNNKEAVSFTYPVIRDAAMSEISNMFARKSNERKEAHDAAIPVADLNNVFATRSKVISIAGIKDINEAELSVYNEEQIKAASLFDGNLIYTYELAIPLKYLALPNNGADAFSYQIKLNEPPAVHMAANGPPPPPMMMTQVSTTDFWGTYKLVK